MSPSRAVSSSRIIVAACVALVLAGCGHNDEPDAYGNFEATETVVSAETGGRLLWFTPVEGQQVAPGVTLAVIDTTGLALDRAQLRAQRTAVGARVSESERQIGVLAVQREIAGRSSPSRPRRRSSSIRRSATTACSASRWRRCVHSGTV
jgi:multidrug efflux pump subunit AcrA (membrane-fusion protein)